MCIIWQEDLVTYGVCKWCFTISDRSEDFCTNIVLPNVVLATQFKGHSSWHISQHTWTKSAFGILLLDNTVVMLDFLGWTRTWQALWLTKLSSLCQNNWSFWNRKSPWFYLSCAADCFGGHEQLCCGLYAFVPPQAGKRLLSLQYRKRLVSRHKTRVEAYMRQDIVRSGCIVRVSFFLHIGMCWCEC